MLTLGGNVATVPAKAESSAGTSAPDATRHGPTTIPNDAKHAEWQHRCHEHEAASCSHRHG